MPITSTPYTAVYGPLSVAGATCQLWLDGVDPLGNGSVPANGSTVSTWMDKSGNGRNAPANTIGGTFNINALNGNGGINFDTLNTKYYRTPSFVASSTNTPTIFLVCQQTVYNSSQNSSIIISENTYFQFVIYTRTGGNSNTNLLLTMYNTDIQPIPPTGVSIVSPSITCVVGTGAPSYTATIYGNGTFNFSFTGTATNPMSASSTYLIGASPGNFIGNIYEVIFYNTALADTQRQKIEGYLAQKWGLTSQLPPGHPGLTQTLYNSKVYQSRIPLSPEPIYQNFNPKQLTGCQLWLDALDSNYITLSGTSVVTVLDKSGNGNTLSGGSGWTYNVTKFNSTYPSFYRATTGSVLGQNNTFSITSSNITVFFVGEVINTGGQYYLVDGGSAGINRFYTIIDTPTNIVHGNSVNGNNNYSLPATVFQPFIFSQSTGTSPQTGSYNGTAINASAGTVGTITWSGITVGGRFTNASDWWSGHICEVIIYSTALSTNQRQQVEGYLAWKWGLQNSLVNHPYKNVPPGLPWQASLTSGLTRLPPIVATGGTITFSGAFKIHTFTTVGTTNFVVSQVLPSGFSLEVLVVGGGGGGGGDVGGGGGAGGYQLLTNYLVSQGSYPITIGIGGTGVTSGTGSSGGSSSFANITATGGSGGASYTPSTQNGGAAGTGGFSGGTGYPGGGNGGGGGGGGLGGAGVNGALNTGGTGGIGITYNRGTTWLLGGGGGGAANTLGTASYGGGNGGNRSGTSAVNGTPNTGGGGGGGSYNSGVVGANGGSGIVIISYLFS